MTKSFLNFVWLSKMILLCFGKESIYSSTSTGSDVIMTINCMYDFISFFLPALLKMQVVLREKKILESGRTLVCISRKRGFKISQVRKSKKE